MSATSIATSDRGTQAYQRLRELIVRGRLAPGSRLIETEIAARLRVSRTPVRSALQRLTQEGYIVETGTGRQSRPVVAPLTQSDARELFYIVGEIEGLAAWRAARQKNRHETVGRLNRINSELLAEVRGPAPSRERIFELDTSFHRCYVEDGAGPRLLALHDAIKPQIERYTRLYVDALRNQIAISVREHQVTVDNVSDGAAELAQSSVRTNWRNAAERLSGVIERAGELGSW